LDGQDEEGVIAAAGPPGAVGCRDQGIGLVDGEELEHRLEVAFGWNGEHAGDGGGVFDVAEHGLGEHGPDRAQSGVAG
jgi:hypothetical protein